MIVGRIQTLLVGRIHTLLDGRKQVVKCGVMVLNATFNNISVISWCSVLLVEETRVPERTTDLSHVTDKQRGITDKVWFRFFILVTKGKLGKCLYFIILYYMYCCCSLFTGGWFILEDCLKSVLVSELLVILLSWRLWHLISKINKLKINLTIFFLLGVI
jgi:hypothetical protein